MKKFELQICMPSTRWTETIIASTYNCNEVGRMKFYDGWPGSSSTKVIKDYPSQYVVVEKITKVKDDK